MLKKILMGLLILIVVVVIIAYFSLNYIVKHGIQTFGPQALGVPVTVDNVNLSPWSGSLTISGLEIGNPKPFKGEYLANVKEIHAQIDIGSLFSDTIQIKQIRVDGAHLIYETGFGGSNLGQLQANISKGQEEAKADTTKTTKTESKEPGKTVIIQQLNINNTKVTGGAFGAKLNLVIPNIAMKDLGKPGSGMSMAQISSLIVKAIFSNMGRLGVSVVSGAADVMGDVANTAADTASKVGSSAGDAVKGAAKGVGDAIGSVFGGSGS